MGVARTHQFTKAVEYITIGFDAAWLETRAVRNHSLSNDPCATLTR